MKLSKDKVVSNGYDVNITTDGRYYCSVSGDGSLATFLTLSLIDMDEWTARLA